MTRKGPWKFAAIHGLIVLTALGLVLGGGWTWMGVVGTVGLAVLLDLTLPEDRDTPDYRPAWLLDALPVAVLPLMLGLVILLLWVAARGDLFWIGWGIHALTGFDPLATRTAGGWLGLAGAVLSTGMMIGSAAIVVGHELIHRRTDRRAFAVGRWLLALGGDAPFSIEHVFGHHRHVGTPADPATARRGEGLWAFTVRSTVQQWCSAWRIEAARLARRGQPVWSARNEVLRGHLMFGSLLALAWMVAGSAGLAAFAAAAVLGKLLLECVNYIEHYGLVRHPDRPVELRHAWNTTAAFSAAALFNLPRHSHHHLGPGRPYHRLTVPETAPLLPWGYMVSILLALIPPLWHRLMAPHLHRWDHRHASAEERALLAAQAG